MGEVATTWVVKDSGQLPAVCRREDEMTLLAGERRRGKNTRSDTKRLGCVEPSATNEGRLHTKRV